ncbi:MAG: ABC transporter substrate-binding protein [Bacillota bacterium]|nr:ABC transporter substrate-binding protein [Bacillota bacterium]
MSSSPSRRSLRPGLVAGLLALALAVGACGGSPAAPSGPATSSGGAGAGQASPAPIKIGMNFELSGAVATFGVHARQAADLAIDQINQKGGVLGRKLQAVTLDNKSDNGESTNVAERLVSEGVVAVVGPVTTGDTLAAVQVVTQAQIPLVTPGATAVPVTVDTATGKVRDWIFRVCFIDPVQGTVGADFAYKQLHARSAVILEDSTNDYSKGLAAAFKQQFEKLGGKVVLEQGFTQADQDFRSILTTARTKNPDLIYVPAYYDKVGLIVRQARDLGITVPMMGGDGWDSPDLVKLAGAQALNNTYFTNHYSSQDPDPKVQAFVQAYKARYGDVPDALAALGYDAVMLVADAIQRAGSADPAKIREALAATTDFQGVTGKIALDAQHNPSKPVVLIEMKDGQQTFAGRFGAE